MKSKGFSIGIVFLVLMVCTACTKDEILPTPDGELSALKKASKAINVPGDYPTIQAAVDAAVNGDIIMVSFGTYEGNINITNIEDLTLIGDNSIIQIEIGSGIKLFGCNNFKISGFELNGEDKSFPAIGLRVQNSSGEISECVVNGFWHGIYATNSHGEQSELLVTECDIQEFEKYGVVTWEGVHSSINKNSFLKSVVTPGIGVVACVSVWGGTPKIKLNNFNSPDHGITITDYGYNINGQLISVNAVDSEIKSNDFHNCFTGIRISTIFGGEVLNTLIINNAFFDVNTKYQISVDENEVLIRPEI